MPDVVGSTPFKNELWDVFTIEDQFLIHVNLAEIMALPEGYERGYYSMIFATGHLCRSLDVTTPNEWNKLSNILDFCDFHTFPGCSHEEFAQQFSIQPLECTTYFHSTFTSAKKHILVLKSLMCDHPLNFRTALKYYAEHDDVLQWIHSCKLLEVNGKGGFLFFWRKHFVAVRLCKISDAEWQASVYECCAEVLFNTPECLELLHCVKEIVTVLLDLVRQMIAK